MGAGAAMATPRRPARQVSNDVAVFMVGRFGFSTVTIVHDGAMTALCEEHTQRTRLLLILHF